MLFLGIIPFGYRIESPNWCVFLRGEESYIDLIKGCIGIPNAQLLAKQRACSGSSQTLPFANAFNM